MPKYHWLPFLVWCMSGSRALASFLTDGGAAIIVASAIVPSRTISPAAVSLPLTASNSFFVKPCCSRRCLNCNTVVPSGAASLDRSIPTKARSA